ncbi:unnamed protein product, partial [Thlaspi arvense]
FFFNLSSIDNDDNNNKNLVPHAVLMSLTVLMGCCCSAKIYKAKLKEFHVGDSLIFKYDRKYNDVTQVSGALEYKFCDSSSPKAVYKTGHDVVTLTEPGSYYFISSNPTQCLSGQRLNILVVHDLSHRLPPPPSRKIFPFGKTYSVEISGDLEFLSCDPTSVVAVHNTGQDLVRLTKPGINYFISSKTDHCEAGLKLQVVVGPLPKAYVPRKMMKLSPLDRLIKWLQTFRPRPHH